MLPFVLVVFVNKRPSAAICGVGGLLHNAKRKLVPNGVHLLPSNILLTFAVAAPKRKVLRTLPQHLLSFLRKSNLELN